MDGGSNLGKAIAAGEFVVTAEYRPPRGTSVERLLAAAESLAPRVHAVCAPESEDGARMCSMAACQHLAAAGAEPILHLLTRDMNRISHGRMAANIVLPTAYHSYLGQAAGPPSESRWGREYPSSRPRLFYETPVGVVSATEFAGVAVVPPSF